MGRLIVVAVVLAGLVLIAAVVSASWRPSPSQATRPEDHMPNTVKTVSYVLLILLMFGIVTGVIGGL